MKKCTKCGAVQDDSRFSCIDCGTVLPKPMKEADEKAQEDALDDKLDSMTERTAEFWVPRWAKILGIVCTACFAGAVLFLALSPNRRYAQPEGIFITLFCSVTAAVSWLFPRFMWWMDTIGKRWWFAGGEKLHPSPAYITVLRVVGGLLAVVAILGFVALISTATKPAAESARGFTSTYTFTAP